MRFKRQQPLTLNEPADHTVAPAGFANDFGYRSDTRPKFRPMADDEAPPTKTTPAPRTDATDGYARWTYPAAAAAAVIWAGALVAFVMGFQTRFGAFDYSALQWTVIGLLAVLPAAFILLAAHAIRQGARLAVETRRARELAEDLAIPAALAADQTGGAMEAMRREIERASEAARDAQFPISALREALAEESRKLAAAAVDVQETGRQIAESLGRERTALGELAGALRAQADEAAQALTLQTRVVAETSDLAQVQLQEAQAALAARAADLALAAGDAGEAAVLAGEQLSRQVERLESAGETLGQRLSRLQLTIADEREQVSHLAGQLRLDQEDFTALLEQRRAQLHEAVVEARDGAVALDHATEVGADALRELIATASEEVHRLAEVAQREQEALDAKARSAVSLFSGAVAEERAALEAQTRAAIHQLAAAADEARQSAAGHVATAAQAAAEHVSAARTQMESLATDTAARIDHLGEAAFAAGAKADELFESRIAAARRMIEQSATLVEESGDRSARHVEAGLASARIALQDMQGLLVEIDARFARLPDEARSRAEAVRDAVERGVNDLTAAARRASEETQAIDAAFQDRVRRNYEVLAEAMRVMGRASAPDQSANRPTPPIQSPVPSAANAEPEAAEEQPPVELRSAVAVGERTVHVGGGDAGQAADPLRPAALSEPMATIMEPRRAEPPSTTAGLRPRLRLTPAPAEDAIAAMFEPAVRPAEAASMVEPGVLRMGESADPSVPDEWTWKDLLASMDEPIDDEALAERLMDEIRALGVDAAVLLPRAKIDGIAAVVQAGEPGRARDMIRQMAPAAVRRVSRRVLTDRTLRAEADRYVRRYEGLVADAVERDVQGHMTAALLSSDPGRAFLLLDAAIGDLH